MRDERLQQETLCRRQWTDEYVERPETRQNVQCSRPCLMLLNLQQYRAFMRRCVLYQSSLCSSAMDTYLSAFIRVNAVLVLSFTHASKIAAFVT